MDFSKSLSPELLEECRSSFRENTISKLAARAVSKTGINEVCYDTEHAKKMNHKFSVEIPTMAAANQKASGRCWIFAALNLLREKIAKELNLENFELSQNFISFYDHLEKANSFLSHIIETAERPLEDRYVSLILTEPVGDGGWWEFFVGLCSKYGVVPGEAMPETYQSSHTASLNMLLNMQLRKDAVVLRKKIAAGAEAEEITDLKTEMLKQAYNLIAICLGTPPETFDFEYVDRDHKYHADRNLTPRAFYDKYLGRDLEQIVSILNAPCKPWYETYVTENEESLHGCCLSKRLNLPMEEFKAAVIRQLQDGDPVWFTCDCDFYGSREEGIWDTGLYDYETPFGLNLGLDKGDLLDYRQCSLNHAMLLTGVNLADGRPDKWKIQNSWGTEKADKGYFIMSDAWFDRFVFTASIDRKYLTEEQRKLFDREPVVLPPWNVLA